MPALPVLYIPYGWLYHRKVIDNMRTILTIWTQPKKTFEYLDKNGAPGFKNNVDVLFYIGSLALALPGIPQMVLKYKALNDLPMIFGILFSIIGCMVGAFFGALIFNMSILICCGSLEKGFRARLPNLRFS